MTSRFFRKTAAILVGGRQLKQSPWLWWLLLPVRAPIWIFIALLFISSEVRASTSEFLSRVLPRKETTAISLNISSTNLPPFLDSKEVLKFTLSDRESQVESGSLFLEGKSTETNLEATGHQGEISSKNGWSVGKKQARLEVVTNRGVVTKEAEINFAHVLDFSQYGLGTSSDPKFYSDPLSNQNARGRVNLDNEAGCLCLEPEGIDLTNATYTSLPIDPKLSKKFKIGLLLIVEEFYEDGGLQISLSPSQYSIQYADGGLSLFSFKKGDHYIDRRGFPLSKYRKDALISKLPNPIQLGRLHWIWLTFSPRAISLSFGEQASEKAFIQPLPSTEEAGERKFYLRSYGSRVSIYKIVIAEP